MSDMDAKLRAKLKAWDWDEKNAAMGEMLKAANEGDIQKTQELLTRFPVFDQWIPYEAIAWSQIAAAYGQLELMVTHQPPAMFGACQALRDFPA